MSITRTTKVCEICGDDYKGIANQKYCPSCGKNPQKARKHYEISQKILNRHAGVYDQPKTKSCGYCKKEFLTYSDMNFCSDNCRKQYRIENACCTFCGIKLHKLGIIIDREGGVRFCSDSCREKYRDKRRAMSARYKRICPQCKKEFEGKDTIFCSNECYVQAKAEGWKPEKFRKTNVNCEHCGKEFQTREMTPSKYCPTCIKLAREIRMKKYEKEKQQQTILKRQEEIERNGLCFYCQTTYSNCEKMKTNFRYYPKDAKMKQGKVIECPSYTEKIRK